MELWEFSEIQPGYSAKIVDCIHYLERPEIIKIYNAPFEVISWLWFLAYVVNCEKHHKHIDFKLIPKKIIPLKLRKDQYKFHESIEAERQKLFDCHQFAFCYSSLKGFHLTAKTTVWLDLICSLVGKCYSMPLAIMNSLDSMGLYYFHDNGLIVGTVAFVNHECACEISYGFDWPLSTVRKSRISDNPLSTVVPIYLSWDFAKVNLDIPFQLTMNSEVVVKYFDHQGVSGHENEIQWFKGQCHCQICKPSWDVLITHYTDTDDPSYCRAIGILDPAQQSKLCYDMSDYGYTSNETKTCIAQSKARKYKAFKRTKQFYEVFPKIIVSKPRQTLVERMQNTTRTTHIPDPTATIWREYLINLRKKAF